MTANKAKDSLLTECEPYFLDAVHTIAQFSQKTQELVRAAVQRQRGPLVASLGFGDDAVNLTDWAYPDKLQRAAPTGTICLGVKLKVLDRFQAGFGRYWTVENRATGIQAYIWVKGRRQLSQLGDQIDELPDMPPGPEEPWSFGPDSDGSYFISKDLAGSDLDNIDAHLDELIAYYIVLLTKINGAKRFIDYRDFNESEFASDAPPPDE